LKQKIKQSRYETKDEKDALEYYNMMKSGGKQRYIYLITWTDL
jgi:hypothetical protein